MNRQNRPNLTAFADPTPPIAILLPPLPVDARREQAMAGPSPCAALTPEALQEVLNKIAQSLSKAENDVSANGTTGAYAVAAIYNRDYLSEVQQNLLFLRSWLKSLGLDTPFVTNASASYSIHGYVREAVCSLHYARHWATISVVYHKSEDAFDSYNLTSEAIDLAEAVGVQAGRCYISGYFP